ncbi:acyltransferase family protein [Sphingomonas immobilis]|uniref:Acyltransferase n=1 Tax=Sphingomonas immobilis TaxID=3063997 RepID=A0ABT9A0U1_9SPHN|nr:acyltransferase [Sphingomonas sp. CA1-15]MDO7843077.1 acyltransferase [Sphingomonas sp. CA1-15]
MARDRIELIDVARGLAALGVSWSHIVMKNPRVVVDDGAQLGLHYSAVHADLGVFAFYIVSGFVIPLALLRGQYRIGMFWRFMAKRLTRLQPPYYLSIALVIAVAYLATRAPGYSGIAFAVDPAQIALHIAYLPTVFGYEWINPVYWSLLVEVEYYIAVGLAMPLLMRLRGKALAALLMGLCLIPLVLNDFHHLPFHLPYFVVGLALCLRLDARLSAIEAGAVILFAVVALAFQQSPACAIVAVATLPFFIGGRRAPALLRGLGAISYSLYLVHYPVGWRAVRLLERFAHNDVERIAAYLGALAISIAVAIVFYYVIEKPSLRWAARIKLTGIRRPTVDVPAAIPAP